MQIISQKLKITISNQSQSDHQSSNTNNPLVTANGPSQHQSQTAHVLKLSTNQRIYGQVEHPANRGIIPNSQNIYGHTVSQPMSVGHQIPLPPIPHPGLMAPPPSGRIPHGPPIAPNANRGSHQDIYGRTTMTASDQHRIYGQLGDPYNVYGLAISRSQSLRLPHILPRESKYDTGV